MVWIKSTLTTFTALIPATGIPWRARRAHVFTTISRGAAARSAAWIAFSSSRANAPAITALAITGRITSLTEFPIDTNRETLLIQATASILTVLISLTTRAHAAIGAAAWT